MIDYKKEEMILLEHQENNKPEDEEPNPIIALFLSWEEIERMKNNLNPIVGLFLSQEQTEEMKSNQAK